MSSKKTHSPSPRLKTRKRGNSTGRATITIIVVALLTVVVGIYLITEYGDKILPYLIPKKISRYEIKSVRIYFSNEEGKALKAEERDIAKETLSIEIREAIHALISGPKGGLTVTIPDGTRLLSVEVKDTVAFLNFSKEISDKHPGGSSAELQTIYSVVDTVTLNFPEIKKVQLLIEGKKVKTLAGHIDISFPLGPNKDLIKG